MNFTEEQRKAIDARDTNILLSAAAGSGKTATLVERVIDLINEGTHIDRMLIVTFTRAAALGMRKKLTDALIKQAAEGKNDRIDPSDELLRLERAQISTIHSFCTNFLREYFEAANVEPAFSIMDEADVIQQKEKAIDAALEDAYENADEALLNLDYGRGAEKIRTLVSRLMDWLESRPNPEEWLENALNMNFSVYINEMADDCKEKIAGLIARYENILNTDLPPHYIDTMNVDLENLKRMYASEDASELASMAASFKAATMPRKGTKEYDQELIEKAKDVRDDCKEIGKCALASAFGPSARSDMASSIEDARVLIKIAKNASGRFEKIKAERGMLTYSDLEIKTLNALKDDETAKAVQDKYSYIFVDEYQDTSDVQENIILRISRGDNLFMVGDVKQSIYRFRMAEPRNFLDKSKSYQEDNGGRLLYLTRNFRSSKPVIDFVNAIFERLMTGGVSMIEYDKQARLNPGADIACDIKPEFYIVNGKSDDDYTADEREAIMITRIIKSEMEKDPTLKYSDFAVLTRRKSAAFNVLVPIFTREGIPCFAEGEGGYFETMEVRLALSLLKIIDNIHSDTELIGVLRSCVCRLSNDELAKIRLEYTVDEEEVHPSFANAVLSYSQGGDDLARRLKVFLDMIDELRKLSPDVTLGELVRRALDVSGIYTYVGTLPAGDIRRANLDQLIERASKYDRDVTGSLNRFLSYAKKLSEKNKAETANPLGENANVVRLMTVHHSKGLEFRIVIAAQLQHKSQSEKNNDTLLCHRELGMGLKYYDRKLATCRPTLARSAILSRVNSEEKAEELRVLYVLLTRAQERLIMTGAHAFKDGEDEEALCTHEQSPMDAQDFMSMIFSALGKERIDEYMTVHIMEAEKFAETEELTEETAEMISVRPDDAYIERLLWKYPHMGEENLPLKLTASGLMRSTDAPGNIEEMVKRPVFMQNAGLTGTETGTAYHRCMQLLDLDRLRACTEETIGEEIAGQLDAMTTRQLFTRQEREIIRVSRIAAFFNSAWGKMMLGNSDVKRELNFNVYMEAEDVLKKEELRGSKGKVLVQGSIDCCFIHDGKWVLLDYKTNRETDIDKLTEHYHTQLELYSKALKIISGIDVSSRVMCLISQGKWIEL